MVGASEWVTRAFWVLFYGFHLVALSVVLWIVVFSMAGLARFGMLSLLLILFTAIVVSICRIATGRVAVHLGTPSDIGWDPLVYPGQAAKAR